MEDCINALVDSSIPLYIRCKRKRNEDDKLSGQPALQCIASDGRVMHFVRVSTCSDETKRKFRLPSQYADRQHGPKHVSFGTAEGAVMAGQRAEARAVEHRRHVRCLRLLRKREGVYLEVDLEGGGERADDFDLSPHAGDDDRSGVTTGDEEEWDVYLLDRDNCAATGHCAWVMDRLPPPTAIPTHHGMDRRGGGSSFPMDSCWDDDSNDGDVEFVCCDNDANGARDAYTYTDHRQDDEYDSNAEDYMGNDYPDEDDDGR